MTRASQTTLYGAISLRGDKKVWEKFALKAKEEKSRIWDILYPCIEEYISTKKP